MVLRRQIAGNLFRYLRIFYHDAAEITVLFLPIRTDGRYMHQETETANGTAKDPRSWGRVEQINRNEDSWDLYMPLSFRPEK